MKRLTFDGNFCEDVALCGEVLGGNYCENDGCKQRQIWERLKMLEDILGDEYDLNRLRVIVNQRMSLRDEAAKRFKLTANIPVYRLKFLIDENYYWTIEDNDEPFQSKDIGKTVFLTHEAAEKALKEMEENDGND